MKTILLFVLFVVAAPAWAATYYIDYGAANDSANGTSTSTPWKRCPGMNGFAGSYGHAAGDTFIFKGGVTWPTTAFPLNITASGGAGNVDTYGVSPAYYTGGAWARPIFDMQYTWVGGNVPVWVTGTYITISGIEIKGLLVLNDNTWDAYGVGSIAGSAAANNIIIHNCYIHHWRSNCPTGNLPTDINNTDGAFGGVFFPAGPVSVLQCTIGWGEAPGGLAGSCGVAVSGGISIVQSNTFVGTSDGLNSGAYEISYNTFRNLTNSYDPPYHANAIYTVLAANQVTRIHHNVFHDFGTTFQTILAHVGGGGATNTSLFIYDNVFWQVSSPINLDESGITIANSNTRAYVWNNTVQYNPAVGVVKRTQTYHLTLVDVRNNHWISDTNAAGNTNPIATLFSSPGSGSYENPDTLIAQNNLWHTSAQADLASYNIANSWSPTSSGSPTVGYGQNLTSSNIYIVDILGVARPSSGAWDSGAYEYASEAAPAGPAITLGSGITLGAGVTIR